MRQQLVRRKNHRMGILLFLVLGLLSGVPLFASACRPVTSITITNNSSSWEIRHLYLSPVDQDNWGPDQLNGTVVAANGSLTLSNVSCEAASIKVISEDQNGCFLYQTVTCGQSQTWTITNEATPDCGH